MWDSRGHDIVLFNEWIPLWSRVIYCIRTITRLRGLSHINHRVCLKDSYTTSHYNNTLHIIYSTYHQYKHVDKLKRYCVIECWYTILYTQVHLVGAVKIHVGLFKCFEQTHASILPVKSHIMIIQCHFDATMLIYKQSAYVPIRVCKNESWCNQSTHTTSWIYNLIHALLTCAVYVIICVCIVKCLYDDELLCSMCVSKLFKHLHLF